MKHVRVLDGIRGLAILLVMWCHATVLSFRTPFESWLVHLSWWGWIGVDLFFVLSGYLITGILRDARDRPGYFRNFYARRILRIFPLYYALLVFSLFVLPRLLPLDKAATFGRIAGDEVYYWLYLQNFAMARADSISHGTLGITWSLAIEEQFYFVWPLAVFLLSPRAIERAAVGLVGFAFVARALALYGFHAGATAVYVLTPCRVDALAVGALLAVRAEVPGGLARLVPAARIVGASAAVAALALVVAERLLGLTAVYDPGRGPITLLVGFTLNALAFGALLVLVIEAQPGSTLHRIFASPLLCTFGVYAYGLYLVHLPLRAVIRDRVYGPGWLHPRYHFLTLAGSELPGQLLFFVGTTALSLSVAWVSFRLVESPFLRLKRFFESKPRSS